jgi:hypothetical protein
MKIGRGMKSDKRRNNDQIVYERSEFLGAEGEKYVVEEIKKGKCRKCDD